MSRFVLLMLAIASGLPVVSAFAQEIVVPESTVGYPVRIEQLVLSGSELEAMPLTDESPVVIRIDAVFPHGTDHRYDLTVSTLEPGTFDLRDFLQRKDGSSKDGLPAIQFTAKSLLPPGQVEPNSLEFVDLSWLGGYRWLLIFGSLLWFAGLLWLAWPKKRSIVEADSDAAEPTTLRDRLRPLVLAAREGQLNSKQLSELERALIAFWRRQRGLDHLPPDRVITQLREDAEAGPLLKQLETWLHCPGKASEQVDVQQLLNPYANLPVDALEERSQPVTGASR